jgi:hypothetical protein
VIGRFLEAGLLEDVRAVVARERHQEVGHAVPLARRPSDLLGERDPAAELLADRLGDVADVGQRLAVDVGVEDANQSKMSWPCLAETSAALRAGWSAD